MVSLMLTALTRAEDLVIATDVWEGYTSKDERGYYIELLRTIFPPPAYTVKFEFVPFKRSIRMLESGKADIMLGAYPKDIPDAQLGKYPTDADSVSAVVNKELAANWQGQASLTNKIVVAKNAYGFDRYFQTPIKYTEKDNLRSMLQMLKRGRVDAVLDYKKDIQLLWKPLDLDAQFVALDGVIHENVYPGFAEGNPEIKQHYEKSFLQLYKSGEIHKLMRKHKLPEDRVPSLDLESNKAQEKATASDGKKAKGIK